MRIALRGLAVAALAAVVGTIMASPANAGVREGSWELGVFLPFVIFDDPEIDGTSVDIDDAVGVLVRGGYNITENHEVEFTAGQIPTEASGAGQTADVDFTIWQIGYVYNFGAAEDLSPFVGGGIGNNNTEIDEADFDEDDSLFYVNGGVRWFFNDTFGLRFEGGIERVDADPDPTNNLYVGAGVTFVVGG